MRYLLISKNLDCDLTTCVSMIDCAIWYVDQDNSTDFDKMHIKSNIKPTYNFT